MANNNEDTLNNSLDSPKESGLDQSFVGKFVSNIISTTPFSKWFSKDTNKNSGEVRRREDIDDDDFSQLLQPVKRARKSHTERNHLNVNLFESPANLQNTFNNNVNKSYAYPKFPEPMPGPSGYKPKHFMDVPSSTPAVKPLVDEEDNNDTDSSEEAELNSIPPRTTYQQRYQQENSESEKAAPAFGSSGGNEILNSTEKISGSTIPKPRTLFTSSGESSNQSRSLFTSKNSKLNSSLSSRRPSFNASTFGTSGFVDKTLSTKRILSSPFYSGNTIYGGASAYEHRFGNKSVGNLMGQSSNRASSVQMAPVSKVKSTSDNLLLSNTARRILNTLEQYSTPLKDAKKIPIVTKREGILTKHIGATPYARPERRRAAAPNKELQVPTVPELLQMKQKERLQNSTLSVRQLATTSKLAMSQKEYTLPTESVDDNSKQAKHSNKMKSSVSSSMRQKTQPAVEILEDIQLPKVSLPITNLPKFDLKMMSPQNSSKPNSTSTISSGIAFTTQPIVVEATKQPQNAKVGVTNPYISKETDKKIVKEDIVNNYTFSKPLIKSENRKTLKAINCFTFREPINAKINAITTPFNNNNNTTINFKMPEKLPLLIKPKSNGENIKASDKLLTGSVMDVLGKKLEEWECPTCLVMNEDGLTVCVACDEPRPSIETNELSATTATNNNFGEQFKVGKDKWECSACLVRNNQSDGKCIACTTPKPNATTSDKAIVGGFGDKFKPKSDTWECKTCMVRNNISLDKCPCCTTLRTPVNSQIVNNLGSQFKPSSDTWECSTCLIRNKNDLLKCAACETARQPSMEKAAPTTVPKPATITSSFGDKFKPKSDTWECPCCMIRNKSDLNKCAACETVKPGAQKMTTTTTSAIAATTLPKFNFGLPADEWECKTCWIKNKNEATKCAACESPKAPLFGNKNAASNNKSFGSAFKRKADEWECPSCMVRNKSDMAKCACCSVAKPGSKEVPIIIDLSEENKSVNSFNFGIDNSHQFKFGITNNKTTTSTTNEKKESNASTLNFLSQAASAAATTTPTFTFGIQKPQESSSDQKTTSNIVESEKKEIVRAAAPVTALNTPAQASPVVAASKSEEGTPKTMFQFKAATTTSSTVSPLNGEVGKNLFAFGKAPEGNVAVTTPSTLTTPSMPAFKFDAAKPIATAATSAKTTTSENAASPAPAFSFGAKAPEVPASLQFNAKPTGATESNPQNNSFKLFSKPNESPSTSQQPAPMFNTASPFKFEAKIASTPALATPETNLFKFGSASNPTTTSSPAMKRTFGDASTSNQTVSTPPQQMNGFGPSNTKLPAFGSVGSNNPSPFGTVAPGSSENKMFAFGSGTSATPAAPSDMSAVKPNLAFGSQPPQTNNNGAASNAVFSFGSGNAGVVAPQPSGGFNFSQTTLPSSSFNFSGANGKTETQPPPPTFGALPSASTTNNLFGGASNTGKNGTFNFGSNANNNNHKAIFSFGASQTATQQQQPASALGAPPMQQLQPTTSFSFGAGAAMPTAPAPSGEFTYTGPPASFNVADGSQAAGTKPQRKFITARRTRR